MSDLRSKVAYLHGLAEGLDIDASSSEGRVLAAMIDVMGDLAEALDDVYEAQDELADYIEEMDEDLSAVEETIYDDDDDDDDDDVLFLPEEALTDTEDGVEILSCPDCGEALSAGAGEMGDEEFDVVCPVCGCSLQAVDEHGH